MSIKKLSQDRALNAGVAQSRISKKIDEIIDALDSQTGVTDNIIQEINNIIQDIDNIIDGTAPITNPIKTYIAALTQSSTSAPTANITVNTLDGTPVWSYIGVGSYKLTLASAFVTGKVIITPPNDTTDAGNSFTYHYSCGSDDINTIYLNVSKINPYTPESIAINGALFGAGYSTIKIEVYP